MAKISRQYWWHLLDDIELKSGINILDLWCSWEILWSKERNGNAFSTNRKEILLPLSTNKYGGFYSTQIGNKSGVSHFQVIEESVRQSLSIQGWTYKLQIQLREYIWLSQKVLEELNIEALNSISHSPFLNSNIHPDVVSLN